MKNNNQKNDITSKYNKDDLKKIYIHRVVLFVVFFLVFVFFAMKTITEMYPLVSYFVSAGLSFTLSYFMSFTVYEYAKNKGFIIYLLVLGVIILIILRNS